MNQPDIVKALLCHMETTTHTVNRPDSVLLPLHTILHLNKLFIFFLIPPKINHAKPNMSSARAQLWELRTKRGLRDQRFQSMRDLHTAFRAAGFVNRPLPPLPEIAPIDNSDRRLREFADAEFPEAEYSNYMFYSNEGFEFPFNAGHLEVETNDVDHVNAIPQGSASPEHETILHERCYRDSCNAYVVHNKHVFKVGSTWHLVGTPLAKQDCQLNAFFKPIEAPPTTKVEVISDEVVSYGWEVAQNYAQYACNCPGHPEGNRGIDQIDNPQPESGLILFVSGVRRGLHSVIRRGNVVVAGMWSKAVSLSSGAGR